MRSFHGLPYPKRGFLRYLVLLALACPIAWAFTGCANKKTTLPDGTVIEESAPAVKQDTKRFIGDVLRAYSPRPIPPRVEREDPK